MPKPGPVLILASGSPRRRELLARLGVGFEVRPADVDETPFPGEAPEELVRRLAVAKAEAAMFAAPEPDVVVLAADTIAAVDGDVLGKPVDDDDATAMLRRLSGRRHRVLTGVAVARRASPGDGIDRGPVDDGVLGPAPSTAVAVETTFVTFLPLTDADIADYVATGEARDKAGSYGIQAGGGGFVASIEGDFDNVVGLGLDTARRLLTDAGLALSDPPSPTRPDLT
ncbi:MAG: hypothetical protein JWM47_1927 [Acidimicrobiales bacterium]|nr:hypothetical protein [Acidimicrobiales bacterium]